MIPIDYYAVAVMKRSHLMFGFPDSVTSRWNFKSLYHIKMHYILVVSEYNRLIVEQVRNGFLEQISNLDFYQSFQFYDNNIK